MPITRRKDPPSTGATIESPFVGPVHWTVGILVNLANLTNKEIDDYGYVKPGIPLTKAGALLVATNYVFGVTVESIRVANDNAAGTISALGVVELAVVTIGQVNQDLAEDILERAYTAAEIAGFNIAGSKLVLL
jgi:hypothetical protein